MGERTADRAKQENVAVMGTPLGAVYSQLWQEVAWIHQKWAQFVELFGTNPGRVDLLNKAAPSMARTIQDTLFEAVLLHLARLTDPSKSVLSLHQLVKHTKTTPISSSVRKLVDVALSKTEFARDWRNRRLAHRDLRLALGEHAQSLAPASRLAVKEALTAIVSVLNEVSLHYCESTTAFELGAGGDDAVSLLYVIRDGLRAKEQWREQLRRGEIPINERHEAI